MEMECRICKIILKDEGNGWQLGEMVLITIQNVGGQKNPQETEEISYIDQGVYIITTVGLLEQGA